jgi:predicted  nucleic acid-binding Zn-ribbon protein
MDTLVVPLLLILVIVLLAAIAAALGWAAHAARSFRKEMTALRDEATSHLARVSDYEQAVATLEAQLKQAQSDVAGLKLANRAY